MLSSQAGCQADPYGIEESPGQADDFTWFQTEGRPLERPLSGNESKVDFIVTKLLKSEYRHAVQKLEKAVNQTNRNANGGKRFGF